MFQKIHDVVRTAVPKAAFIVIHPVVSDWNTATSANARSIALDVVREYDTNVEKKRRNERATRMRTKRVAPSDSEAAIRNLHVSKSIGITMYGHDLGVEDEMRVRRVVEIDSADWNIIYVDRVQLRPGIFAVPGTGG